MSEVVKVNDAAFPRVQAIWNALAPGRRRPLMLVLGREAETQYRKWFRQRNTSAPNKQGFPRSNFWARIAKATAMNPARTTDSRAVLTVADPALNAHVYGGTWGARRVKNLAIPVHPEAYGKTPRANLIAGIRFIPARRRGNVTGWLAAGEGDQTTFYWRLQKTVTVPRDPQAMPPADQLISAITSRAMKFFFRPVRPAKS